jgi:hypothetical protein
MLGAVAVVAIVAWSAQSRSQATASPAVEPIATQSVETADVPAVAVAAEPAAPAAATTMTAPGEAGMKAYLDPEGGITSIPPQGTVEPLANIPVRPERLPEVTLPDGSIKADLNGQFDEYSVMTIDEYGNRVMHCVQHPDEVHGHAHQAAQDEREVR